MHKAYSKTVIYRVAKDNFKMIKHYCYLLEQEGYWEKPYTIIKKSIYEILDIYIQSVLINMALQCNKFGEDERKFIAGITDTDILCIEEQTEPKEELVVEVTRLFSSPPILLQLCSLRDTEKNSSITGLFFDAILNIVIAYAYLGQIQDALMMQFIQAYFNKVQVFVKNQLNAFDSVDEKYIFRKLCNGDWEYSYAKLLDAKENFCEYKRKAYYNIERPFEQGREFEHQVVCNQKDPNTNVLSNEMSDENQMLKIQEEQSKNRLDALLDELNGLIGLDDVKREVLSLINLIKVKKLRERYHLPDMDMSFHMVFTGNPGTGKTTVARLIAKIYKELGLLSQGNLVETDRAGLVAGYVGQTALKVKEVVDKSIGGVLFIDEAYSLTGNIGSNDFGSEAIDTLVKMMEDHRDDFVVIVAGYTKEMEQFLKANTGLISRFNRFIHFADYTEVELIEILVSMAKKAGFEIEESAVEKVRQYVGCMGVEERRNFGNARGVRNMFEMLVVIQANRVVQYEEPSIHTLTHITDEDVKIFLTSTR